MQDSTPMIWIVATKGRAGKGKILQWLNDNLPIDTILFVEPQEYELYKSYYPNIRRYYIMRENNRGLAYVRNEIYNFALQHEIKYFWMPDDDITGFFDKEGNRVKKNNDPIQALIKAQERFIKEGFYHAGLEYQQYAWSANREFTLNSFVDAVVWFNMDLLKTILPTPPYREELKLKVDRDFCMQVLAKGGTTARYNELSLSMPKEGSNEGGLKEIAYDIPGFEESMVDKLREIWGFNIVEKITKPSGRIDAKIHWDRLIPLKTNQIYDGLF